MEQEDKSYFILDLSHKWVSELHGKEFNSTNEDHCFQSYAFQDGYKQGIEDCLNTLEIYLHDIFILIGVERTMKHLKDVLKDNGMIKEE